MTDQTPVTPDDPWSGYTPYRYDPEAKPVEEERFPLFYMGDTEYTAPRRVSAPAALQALENAATKGIPYATFHLVLDSIGQEAWDILTSSKVVPYPEAQDMVSRLGALYFGQAVALAGK